MLGSHFNNEITKKKGTKMQKCGIKHLKKRILDYRLKQEGRADLNWEGTCKLFTALHVSVNGH